ncbi:MAG: NusG domain II-containing protein [Lachnospiraceae bacterium]|nr:NusG domain II-containing protein [Lachnospiraceae bacterium]
MKKFDLYLAGAMLFIALVWFLITNIFATKGDYVAVYENNTMIAEYPLNEDNILTVESTEGPVMVFEVKNRSVNVLEASCKDKLCVHQKSISKGEETICCLPNKIILFIENSKDSSTENYDAVTR